MKSFILSVMVRFPSVAFAISADVQLVDINNETKTFRYYDSTAINLIPSHLPGSACTVGFVPGKNYVELGCMPSSVASGKGRFTRTFIRVPCGSGTERTIIVNTSKDMQDSTPMRGMSITVFCR